MDELSIVIPTAGCAKFIQSSLNSIIKHVPTDKVEVVVVDNNTDEATSSKLHSLVSQFKHHGVRIVKERTPGLTPARHRGFVSTSSRIVSVLDDDVEVSQTWFSAVISSFRDESNALVGGPCIGGVHESIPNWITSKFYYGTKYGGVMCPFLSLLNIGRNIDNIDPDYIWGLNFSIRREVLFRLGGFHPDLVPSHYEIFSGDGETGLTRKLRNNNFKASYNQLAMIKHNIASERLTFLYFLKRSAYQGRCDAFTNLRSFNLDKCKNLLADAEDELAAIYICNAGDTVLRWVRIAYLNALINHMNNVINSVELQCWVKLSSYIDVDYPMFV